MFTLKNVDFKLLVKRNLTKHHILIIEYVDIEGNSQKKVWKNNGDVICLEGIKKITKARVKKKNEWKNVLNIVKNNYLKEEPYTKYTEITNDYKYKLLNIEGNLKRINQKILINEKKLDYELINILNSLNLTYDIFKNYDNLELDNYFLVIDHDYNKILYLKTIEHKIYYSCNKPKNNHIIENVTINILKKLIFRIKYLENYDVNDLFDMIKSKRVLVCSIWDYGFSAHNLFISLKTVNNYVDYFTFNLDYRNKVLNRVKKVKNSINLIDIDVNNYDIIIFKEDYNLSNLHSVSKNKTNYKLLDTIKKDNRLIKINIVCGSFYRNDICLKSDCPKGIALNTIKIDNKILDFDLVCGLTHDLCYYFDNFFFGHKQIKKDYFYALDDDAITISHSPSNRTKKGTDLILSAINELKQKYNIKLILIENVSQEESIQIKKKSHLFIDQLYAKGYGNSLIEAICFGVPAMANVEIYPILNINPFNVKKNIETFINLSKKDKLNLSKDTYNYYLKYHTFSLVNNPTLEYMNPIENYKEIEAKELAHKTNHTMGLPKY